MGVELGSARLVLLALAVTGLAACQKAVVAPAQAQAQTPSASGYAIPPELAAADRSATGGVELKGTGRPAAQIRLLAPDGTAIPATADASGVWELRALVQEPRLYALAEEAAGRLIRSRGYVALLPAPGAPVVALRPGTGPRALGGPVAKPVITAVDFDRGGAGVVSGLAGAGQVIRVQLDGSDAGEGRSDAGGAFSVSLSEMLHPGSHTVTVRAVQDQGPDRNAQASFEVGPGPTGIKPPMAATRLDDAWRLDWVTPGGGVQTTIAFDAETGA